MCPDVAAKSSQVFHFDEPTDHAAARAEQTSRDLIAVRAAVVLR